MGRRRVTVAAGTDRESTELKPRTLTSRPPGPPASDLFQDSDFKFPARGSRSGCPAMIISDDGQCSVMPPGPGPAGPGRARAAGALAQPHWQGLGTSLPCRRLACQAAQMIIG